MTDYEPSQLQRTQFGFGHTLFFKGCYLLRNQMYGTKTEVFRSSLNVFIFQFHNLLILRQKNWHSFAWCP